MVLGTGAGKVDLKIIDTVDWSWIPCEDIRLWGVHAEVSEWNREETGRRMASSSVHSVSVLFVFNFPPFSLEMCSLTMYS